ncbi:uncharacterized protein B0I36DRAFT_33609 [Microdochium trichocladiopsis]|uniref:Uncharacterized protein n=1 Tax=Microdochium trichocladiopsis TaxID=1682393 RepID=A0A9P8XX99_9PEZI|nr:uncharacterized protein B0I36DRAFT_57482 [Microdochium trichocladiopsis]XP_046007807.1 uncharacterized protein B0I36DRAFT_33609 [Microdochium trichocladiopsis]KAH7010589.1 hypothetical protein B0I36DRAFT_57482 [Microdochium trichocladiopsis]KAH7021606.1 hypothetical protein B0I36DRAFT_33609 [Microdochium trichocladiopsis]
MLASSRLRIGATIRPAAENSRSHSADIGGIDMKSSAITDSLGNCLRLECQYSYGSLTSLSTSEALSSQHSYSSPNELVDGDVKAIRRLSSLNLLNLLWNVFLLFATGSPLVWAISSFE